MRLTESTLRRLIRRIIIESREPEEDEMPFEDTLLPGETNSEEDPKVIGGGDFSREPAREDYLQSKKKNASKKKKARLRSRDETGEHTGDEHAIAGHMDMSGYDGRDRPHGGPPLKSRNAMGDEYDE